MSGHRPVRTGGNQSSQGGEITEEDEEEISDEDMAAILGKEIEPAPAPRERTDFDKMADRPPALDVAGEYVEKLELEELIQRNIARVHRVFSSGSWTYPWRSNSRLFTWLADNIEIILIQLNALRVERGEASMLREIQVRKRKGPIKFIEYGFGKMIQEAQRQGIGLTKKPRAFHWAVDVKKLYQDYGLDGHKKNEPTRRIETMIDFAAACQSLNNDNYDTVACFDNPSRSFLTLSTGKTTVLLHWCHLVDRDFDMEEDMVLKDDYDKFWDLLYDTQSHRATGVDEAHWFLNPTTKEGKEIRDQLKTNRHYNRYWGFATPTIWDTFPYFREKRCLFRICISKRGTAKLYRKGGIIDKDDDVWGVPVSTWRSIKAVPRRVEKEYERLREEAGEKLRLRKKNQHKAGGDP